MSTNWLLNDLAEAKGKQELYTRQSPQMLKALREMALVLKRLKGVGTPRNGEKKPNRYYPFNQVVNQVLNQNWFYVGPAFEMATKRREKAQKIGKYASLSFSPLPTLLKIARVLAVLLLLRIMRQLSR